MRTRIERLPSGTELRPHIERWKRLRRRGWSLTVLLDERSGDAIAFGVLDREREPDPLGQFELDVEV